jgi:hypothetical protein
MGIRVEHLWVKSCVALHRNRVANNSPNTRSCYGGGKCPIVQWPQITTLPVDVIAVLCTKQVPQL